jgi:hypothetical protein
MLYQLGGNVRRVVLSSASLIRLAIIVAKEISCCEPRGTTKGIVAALEKGPFPMRFLQKSEIVLPPLSQTNF